MSADPVCALCGRSDDLVEHHPTTEEFDPRLTITLCHDHHMFIHDQWFPAEVGATLTPGNSLERMQLRLKRLAMLLFALYDRGQSPGAFNHHLAVAFAVWAEQLVWNIQLLDTFHPGWRDLPGMNEAPPNVNPA